MAPLQTVQKIGPVLDLFTASRPEWRPAEIAAAIDAPRSSVHALLSALVDTGLLQCRARGRYRLGWRVVELSEALRATVDVRSCAEPTLQELAHRYGETAHLAVLERDKVLYLDKVLGNQMINVSGARVGARLEPHCSAVGKVLLAQREDKELTRRLTGRPLRRLTPSTIIDPAALTRELASVRRAGCAFDAGEAVVEVHCVAAPVRDEMGVVIAAVSITVPASRFGTARQEFTHAVIAAGNRISRAVAHSTESVWTERDDPTIAAGPDSVSSGSGTHRQVARATRQHGPGFARIFE
ncbi:IclR family transcriptional regulator [Nocardia rhamnosiphila]|uniref:IclR family transcriptional regulator n=1 Tax=Nocardia rhamnosiphila TaxID=426716 RepID=UPI0009DC9D68|nr:IclR family transcriptional regulator [Nocardia rhamnosiphila]